MKALLPLAVICAILVVSDIWLNDGGSIHAANKGILQFGKTVQRTIGSITE